ncbi:hypothetical protein BC835DRAFT_1386497 [Cytidiella melzeri]|nr:hypothetical protein BC835DRAFT_1386497 [Cytidiella melzeri]
MLPRSEVRDATTPPSLELELEGGGVIEEVGASDVGSALERLSELCVAELESVADADEKLNVTELLPLSETEAEELSLEDSVADVSLLLADSVAEGESVGEGEGSDEGDGVGGVSGSVEVAGTIAVVPGASMSSMSRALSRIPPRPPNTGPKNPSLASTFALSRAIFLDDSERRA